MTSDDNWIDADIRAMKLSSGERAGLQIYRNYTRSFETDAVAKFRKALDREPLNLEGLAKLTTSIATEDLRFVPVILCAFCDELLERALKLAIPEGVPGGKAKLFGGYGPLSDLSKRIQMAAAFDVVSPDLMIDLDRVRTVRNRISHSWDAATFKDFYSSSRAAELFPIEVHLAERAVDDPELGVLLDADSAFRVRVIWLAGRLTYEAAFYGLAKKARMNPVRALYDDGGAKWLSLIAGNCMEATRSVIRGIRT